MKKRRKTSVILRVVVGLLIIVGLLESVTLVVVIINRCSNHRVNRKFNEYLKYLNASEEVGNINYKNVLPFGDWQIVLTSSFTETAKDRLKTLEYKTFSNAISEAIDYFNNLKIGYKFSLCSQDNSFGFARPDNLKPLVKWDLLKVKQNSVLGQWEVNKTMFGENYCFAQESSSISHLSYPIGLESFFGINSYYDVDYVSVYGKAYSTSRLLYTYKIFMHEIMHSIGVNHVDSKSSIVPKTKDGVCETYMTSTMNMFYVGDSKFDENTLISIACLRKILNGTQDEDDPNFDPTHFDKFNEFVNKGKTNLNLA